MARSLIITYHGTKIELDLTPGLTAEQVKHAIIAATDADLQADDLKLLAKGKVVEDHVDLSALLSPTKSVHRLVAMGLSSSLAQALHEEQDRQSRLAPRVRDDLSEAGRAQLATRQRLGQHLLHRANLKDKAAHEPIYKFGRIETLPGLPNQAQAREILSSLAHDPGVLACLAKHRWHVGALAELYPEGKVGESPVCVMGLNENHGERILLRLRTDDLQGFRKISSIRKVLYHELAHNRYSEHDNQFFQLMRQIEAECTAMDWTQGAGLSTVAAPTTLYSGGTHRLGGDDSAEGGLTLRERVARAALARMTEEEEEIEANCGCGRSDLFLPKKNDDDHDPMK